MPLALSLSQGAYRRGAWFDKLTTNGHAKNSGLA
tara:strand:- start:525 stop:626 length:102 start_codon:yes stop_codon:yes gene_type:complete